MTCDPSNVGYMSRPGTRSVTNAGTALNGWTPLTVARVQTKTFTAKVRPFNTFDFQLM